MKVVHSAITQVCRHPVLCAITLAVTGVAGADLLTNGNLNLDSDANSKPDGWSSWAWSNDTSFSTFADYKTDTNNDPWDFDGTPYVNAGLWGAWWSGGAGWFQVQPGVAGKAYSFSSFSGSESWSNGAGELRLIYLDDADTTLQTDTLHTVDFQPGKPWTPYTLSSIAPAGTTKVKTEFATWGARGTITWDSATLVEASIWSLPVGGDYLTGTNWINGVPDAIDASAQFNGAIATDEVITIDSTVTLGSLGMLNNFTYQLAGAGSIKLQTTAGDGLVVAGKGTQRINVPLTIASNTAISANDATWLRVSKPVTVNAGMKLTQYGIGSVTYESSITLQDGAGITFGNTMHPTSLALGSNAVATINAKSSGGAKVLTVNSVSIDSGAKLDVNDNALVVDYDTASPLADVRSQLKSGYANGAWTGAGIVSGQAAAVAANPASTYQTGLGYGEASSLPGSATGDLGLADTTAIVVRYTATGDADFNLIVDSLDFDALVAGYGNLSNAVWSTGDFDYDGKVTTTDFNVLAGSFGANLNPPTGPSLGAVVPEPASITLLALGGLLMARRRNA